MKKNITKIVLLVISIAFIGCSDKYFEVNTPTGAADLDQLRMNDLLAPAIYHTMTAQYNAERSFGNYTQYFTGQGGVSIEETSISGAWSQIYLYALPNLNEIIIKANENDASHFSAVAKILVATNLGLATDSWDNIPYSNASNGSQDMQPSFDSQESVYGAIMTLLNEAISQLEGTDSSGFSLGSEDLIYAGNMDKWLRAAYTLKARYQLHLSKVNGVTAATDALASIASGFTSNADDFQMEYDDKNINPWYARQILAAATSNAHDKVGDQLVSSMNGTSYPFESGTLTEDPRLEVYAERENDIDPWRGYITGGDGLSSDGESGNTNFSDGGFYTNSTAPIVLISFAEAKFIEAEAAFLANGGDSNSIGSNTAAYDAYMLAIQANMSKLSVSDVDYIVDTSINVGEGALMLHHIMKEKYIANFLNPETYVDMRRYDFSSDVFKDLSIREDHAEGEYPGEWFLRANYPDAEETRNPESVSANKKLPTVPVWWGN